MGVDVKIFANLMMLPEKDGINQVDDDVLPNLTSTEQKQAVKLLLKASGISNTPALSLSIARSSEPLVFRDNWPNISARTRISF